MASKRKRKQPASSDPPPSDVQVVVFEDPLKKRSKKKETDERIEAPGSSFDWHKARQDVFRFGITGFEHKEQTDAKVSLAVKLGARVCFE